MFLLSSGLSRFIGRDSFRCNLNLLFSFKKIVKDFKTSIMTLRQNVIKVTDFFGFFTRFPVKGVISIFLCYLKMLPMTGSESLFCLK